MANFAKVNDERVNQFIKWSQDAARYVLWQDGKASPSIVDINFVGWRLLKETVRGNDSHQYDNDYDAAAAEHYMYIRFLAGKTGDPACHAAPALYAAKKVLDQALGRLQSGQAQGGHPVLPSNPYILAWGQRGVVDGLVDYKNASNGAQYRVGSAVGVLAAFSMSKPLADRIGDYAIKAGNSLPSGYQK